MNALILDFTSVGSAFLPGFVLLFRVQLQVNFTESTSGFAKLIKGRRY
jgi:hypothetical protein